MEGRVQEEILPNAMPMLHTSYFEFIKFNILRNKDESIFLTHEIRKQV
jgi:hypothetical protein